MEIACGNENYYNAFHRIFGYSLSGLTVESDVFVLYGLGGGGKSTIMKILGAVMGSYMVIDADSATLIGQRQTGSATTGLTQLIGKRVATFKKLARINGMLNSSKK